MNRFGSLGKRPGGTSPYLGLVGGIAGISFAATMIRLADAPPLVVAAYRLTFATLMLAPFAWKNFKMECRGLCVREFGWAMLSGVFLAIHFATWITSLSYTTVASSVVLVATNPLFVAVLASFILKESLSLKMLVGIAIAVGGAMVVGYGDFAISGLALWGDLLALLGAVTGASYFLIGRYLRPRLSLFSYIFIVYATSALTLMVWAVLAGKPLFGYGGRTYLMFVLLALIPQIIGHSSLNWSLKYLSASMVTVAILAEPVFSTIIAYFVIAEKFTIPEVAGGGLILLGIYVSSRAEKSLQKEKKEIEDRIYLQQEL